METSKLPVEIQAPLYTYFMLAFIVSAYSYPKWSPKSGETIGSGSWVINEIKCLSPQKCPNLRPTGHFDGRWLFAIV